MAPDSGGSDRELHFDTRAVKDGEAARPGAPSPGDVSAPIHLATTYALAEPIEDRPWTEYEPADNEYVYSRVANPTRHALEQRLASLHDAEDAFAFASGLAAVSATIMAAVEPGDHVVAFEQVYSGTGMMLREFFEERLDVSVSFVDATDVAAVADAVGPATTLVWMESPTNPRLKLCDIAAIADIAHEAGARLGVDNTFMSPYFQQPLALGADVVVDSTTKYLNGHTDSTGGSVATDDAGLAEALWRHQVVGYGAGLAPFDCYLVLRGLKTFPLRMRAHEKNATAVARTIGAHGAVDRVYYPGLESHPQHDLARRQTSGHGGIVAVELDASYAETIAWMEALDVFELAVSLGGVESLVEHPASMTHSTLSSAERERVGIGESLVRLSVGVEHVDDILDDLTGALATLE